jgi:hypothetical protein
MKDIKNYLVNEAKSYNFKDIKYTLISYYKPEDPLAFLLEDISEISDIYYDWDFKPEDVDKIIEEVNKLQVNECYVNKSGTNDFEVISRIK